MDPNHPYHNANWNPGYNYPPNSNFPQAQFQGNLNQYPQQPPHSQQQQPYYQSPYSQPHFLPRNQPAYYQNQIQQNPYPPQFQQPPQHFYQQPNPPPPRASPTFFADTIEVVIPRHSSHSSTPKQQPQVSHHAQSSYRPPSQPQPQRHTPASPYPRPPKAPPPQPQQQPPPRYAPPPPEAPLRQSSQTTVVIEIPKPQMSPKQPAKDRIRQPSASKPATPQRPPPQSQTRVLQAVEVNVKKDPDIASRAPLPHDSPMKPDEPEPDYPSLLCVLADDYLDEARRQSALTERYYALVSQALGCLESALVNFKLPPLREAQISLRYAQILYDETENHDEAETILAKSIELCERHKFIDMKYEMQILLSKILYESRPKAALRDIQRMIEDIEAYRHTVWLYIFRYQQAMFSLASSAPGEVHSATVQLEKITVLAKQNSDVAVLAFAATLEALLHLSGSSHEAITSTQTALSKARAMQLNPHVESNPQLTILMEFIDLACSVREASIAQNETKRKIMHDVLFAATNSDNWSKDGHIYLPISKRSMAGIQVQANKHVVEKSGGHCIVFSWLSADEVEALGYLFSADSSAYKNGADGGKAEKFAKEGLKLARASTSSTLSNGQRQSQKASLFQKLLEAEFLLLLTLMRCSKGRWQAASDTLREISTISEDLGDLFPVNMRYALLYLRGVILQGTGNLTAALQVYQSPLFSFGPQDPSFTSSSKTSNQIITSYFADSDVTRNFSILAAMNSAFIIQSPGHPQYRRLSPLIKSLDPAIQSCGNKYIQAHFSLLVSVLSGTTLTVKQYLKSAMEAGKAIGSAQTTALALIYMQEKLFKGVVEEQALKCARAASAQTKRWSEPMWMHVAAGLEAQALEINGFEADAARRTEEAEAVWETLPEDVKRATAS